MLVLTRKVRERITIGDDIVVTILQVRGRSVRVGIEAPMCMRVLRAELPPEPAGSERLNIDEHQETKPATAPVVKARIHGHAPLASRLPPRPAPNAGLAPTMRSEARLGPALAVGTAHVT
jgi:carbon storage regulator